MVFGIVGPTAVGKTSVSIALAKELSAEIVSVDSRQIYRELSIGTAKPTQEQLAAVPHHFVDERSLRDPITAAEYASEARQRIAEIRSRGRHALLVGGSTLYLHALIFGLDDVPSADPAVRKRLQARLDTEGLFALVSELAEKDPSSYEHIDRNNPRRVLRALEVFEATGQPLSRFQAGSQTKALGADVSVLNRARDDLYRRINRRAAEMVADGLIEEVKVLLDMNYSPAMQALHTIGYQEVFDLLAGKLDRDELTERISRNTRRYAKRQLTWFRRYDEFKWIDVSEDEGVASVCSRVLDLLSTEE